MVQSGIAYAAGQLLAVVAPRTVLVVDAPTDWSLAGPLWELALDDAPVDEILDVLIRRGIRTAPSFAIVRVENDAVRALVRGSVPVCFERAGEPVRLDATGATTWLEGLISSARRVLVGAVTTNSALPYLVSTGVVLVSGLALPCGPGADPNDVGTFTPGISEPGESGGGPAASSDAPYFSRPTASPVSSAGGPPSNGAVIREPRVVDLTRSGGRAPAKSYAATSDSRSAWALAPAQGNSAQGDSARGDSARGDSERGDSVRGDSEGRVRRGDLNGHVPAVLDPVTTSAAKPDPAVPEPESPGEPWRAEAAPAAGQADFRFDPIDFTKVSADDPGELQDLDVVDQPNQSAQPQSLDDLLAEPIDEEPPPGPSPADLPNLDPPSLSLPMRAAVTGLGVPAQPRNANGFSPSWPAAGWPPPPDSFSDHAEQDSPAAQNDYSDSYPGTAGEFVEDAEQAATSSASGGDLYGSDQFGSDQFGSEQNGSDHAAQQYEDAQAAQEPDQAPASSAFLPPPNVRPGSSTPPPLGELPLRVRGRSLRPEHRPLNGNRLLGEPDEPSSVSGSQLPSGPVSSNPVSSNPVSSSPVSSSPVINPVARSAGSSQPYPSTTPASGALLLPAFFRGARAARKPDPAEPGLDAPENAKANGSRNGPSAPAAWLPQTPNSSAPAAWAPPVRRGFPDRSGFNGGPPAMPGGGGPLRPAGPASSAPSADPEEFDDQAEEPTEVSPPARSLSGSANGSEALREPPRLLGVWCDAGHVTSPDHEECRVCGLVVPAQAPILVARPPLGVLIFDNGDRVLVDRPVVLGRDPKPVASHDGEAPVLHPVPSATGQVSRTHAEIRASGWEVVLTDLDAMNGTALTLPGASPVAIEPGVPTLITPGARVDLGGESGFVFEVEG